MVRILAGLGPDSTVSHAPTSIDSLRRAGCHGTLRILAFLTELDVVEGHSGS